MNPATRPGRGESIPRRMPGKDFPPKARGSGIPTPPVALGPLFGGLKMTLGNAGRACQRKRVRTGIGNAAYIVLSIGESGWGKTFLQNLYQDMN
jgi:hypothetical protein